MKRTFFLMMILIMALTLIAPAGVQAQTTASTQTWTSSIYYYNPYEDAGSVTVTYYSVDSLSTPSSPPIPVEGHGSGEIFIGDVGVGPGFKGSAVLSSDIPLMAVYEQAPGGKDPNYGRLLYTAFDVSQGSQKIYIPNFVRGVNGFDTQVGIQNISAGDTSESDANVILTFYKQDGTVALEKTDIPPIGASESYIFTGEDVGIPTGFDGSLVIDAGDKKVVAAAEELQTNGRSAYAFEGVSAPSSSVYMPSMLCRFSPGAQSTVYAIQNTGTEDAEVQVTVYSDATKKMIGTIPYTLPAKIRPGAKYLLDVCKIKGTAYKGGGAVITSTNGQNLAVVGKTKGSGGLLTAFTGKAAGSTRTILPYVVWTSNAYKGYRTTIWVMNVGDAPAKNVIATFYKPDGTVAKTVPLAGDGKPVLPSNIRVKIDPSTAKALRSDNTYRGGVEINSDEPVVVTVRLERKISGVKGYTIFGEDYLGVTP